MTGVHCHIIGFRQRHGAMIERLNRDTWVMGPKGAIEALHRFFREQLENQVFGKNSADTKQGDLEFLHCVLSVSRKTSSSEEMLKWLAAIRLSCDHWMQTLSGLHSVEEGELCIDDEMKAALDDGDPETLIL